MTSGRAQHSAESSRQPPPLAVPVPLGVAVPPAVVSEPLTVALPLVIVRVLGGAVALVPPAPVWMPPPDPVAPADPPLPIFELAGALLPLLVRPAWLLSRRTLWMLPPVVLRGATPVKFSGVFRLGTRTALLGGGCLALDVAVALTVSGRFGWGFCAGRDGGDALGLALVVAEANFPVTSPPPG